MKKEYPRELIDFLVERHGGETVVFLDFSREKIAKLAAEEKTLRDLLDVADREGFREILETVTLNELATLVHPPAPSPPSASATSTGAPRMRVRLSADERSELHERILSYLGDNPWTMNAEIARAIDLDSKRLGAHLRDLKKEGKITSSGAKTNMRYALGDEKSKPPRS